ncbi:probable cytochrome P450 313b1 [Contarinia nasturtii]|uniref:probable cytochrome P450 313b1 n=1 Tax=Contarinia nasturtii TaxID=265458 RepID=UPI0012D491CF|nr:probable cytochrome P450 313b1 [Contarinia nasturtii]
MLFRYYLLATVAVIVLWWLISYLISCFFYKRRVTKFTRNLPVLDDYALLGCALRFLGKNNKEILETIEDVFTKQKLPFLGWLGPKCFIVVDHPEDIQVVMNSKGCIDKSDVYRFFNRGVGLFTAPGMILCTISLV